MVPNFFIPNPPKDFGCEIFSQLVIWSFLLFIYLFLFFLFLGSWPHQKALTMESSLLHMGMEFRTELIRVSLLAWERSLAFHPWSLVVTLWMRSWKSLFLLPLSLKLIPRYFPGCLTSLTLNELAKLFFWGEVMFGEQYSSDFSRLVLYPESWQYQARVDWMEV